MKHAAALALVVVAAAACGQPVSETQANPPAAAPPIAEAPPPAAPPVAQPPQPQQPAVTASPAPPPPPAVTAGDFNLTGTEPFWGMKVRANTLTLSRMDHADVSVPAPAPQVTGGTMVWRIQPFTVTIRPGECSDGMSDRRYPYEAQVNVGNEVLKGCAFRPGTTVPTR